MELASAACVCSVLIYDGLCVLYLCIMAAKGTLYPSVTLPRHGMMFMERCMNIGRCVELDEIVYSSVHVCCLFVCLFVCAVFVYLIVLLFCAY